MNKKVFDRKRKDFRQFRDYDYYDQSKGKYFLMPFNFHRINKNREVLINEIGDFIFAPVGTYETIVKRELSKEKHPELYQDLVSNHFISEEIYSPNIDLIATRFRTKKLFLDRFTSLHIFVISLRCEHTCAYCQVSRVTQNKEKYDMSLVSIDKGIEFMMKSPNPNVTMEFQGGEALLAFDNIKYAIKKAQEFAPIYGKSINYVICTNLALINEEILEYCKINQVLISTSLDGPKYVHDKNRNKPNCSSYDLTIRGIELSREILGHDKVSALMTTSSHSLNYPVEIVNEYFEQGFSGIFLRNISPYGFALRTEKNRYETEVFLHFYKKALNRIIQINKEGHFFTEDFSKIILTKILTPFNIPYVDLQSPAGLINGVVVFNYDGAVYATDESRMLAEQKDFSFRLGHLLENKYEEIIYGLKSRRIAQVWTNESLAGCSECAFRVYCGADPVHNWATQGDMYGYRPSSAFCNKNMEVIRYLLTLMDSDDETRDILESWIK
ncbi:His-Xaa-Ser system radical SAM maturase HxsB [Winogradskyella sp.]|uniref:His-Xaa-Ser system radical SAM maturase HxsB n=1 Tax=Winogradskyella sp. TaxID=1883156 RepID=UPI002608DD41|nr:His-Xaa-Ser system radical SAM maturase HxsB [Winogradskyella sp.]